jgi:hypothetical protein
MSISSNTIPILWQVEVSDGRKILFDKELAYQYAEKLQLTGRNVEIFKNGCLVTRLKSRIQYSLFL